MKEKEKSRSRKKKPFPVKAAAASIVVLAAAVGIGAGYYIQKGKQYETVFFPSTLVNGMDVSNRSVGQVEEMISARIDDYVLTLNKRNGETEQITKEEIDLHFEYDGSLEKYLSEQDPMDWWRQQSQPRSYETQEMIAYDEDKLAARIDSLDMFKEELVIQPENAYLSDYIPGKGFQVIPETKGTVLDKEKVTEGIREAIESLKTDLVLEDLGAYKEAEITGSDVELNQMADRLNRYVTMTVTYTFGETKEVLDGDTIINWMSVGEDGQVSIDQEQVTAYVKELASRYNTAYKPKKLATSYGETVDISKGFYGWRINQSQEAEELYHILLSGESQTREPVYLQKGASHGENDYGDTYVEINLTAQHLFFYKNGQLVIESDFVSGNQARGYDTPSGAYPLTYKQRNAVLKGENYRTPVSYWMPFNGNIGMHDANWRGSFGGNIYKTNGSHGCINLPPAAAKTIFENIEAGMPVLCYHLDRTATTAQSVGGTAGGGTGTANTVQAPPAASEENPQGTAGEMPEGGQGTGQEDVSQPSSQQPTQGTVEPAGQQPPQGIVEPSGQESQPQPSQGTVEPANQGNITQTEEENQQNTSGEIGPGVGNGGNGTPEIGPGVGL